MSHDGASKVILIDCSDGVRKARLLQRGQPELANEQMMEWGRYLLRATKKIGGEIINNDNLSPVETAAAIETIVDGHAPKRLLADAMR